MKLYFPLLLGGEASQDVAIFHERSSRARVANLVALYLRSVLDREVLVKKRTSQRGKFGCSMLLLPGVHQLRWDFDSQHAMNLATQPKSYV